MSLVNSGIERLVTFGATSAALALFLNADLDGLFSDLSRADVMVSYVLLIGAVALDLSSILMVISSYCGITCLAKEEEDSQSELAKVLCSR